MLLFFNSESTRKEQILFIPLLKLTKGENVVVQTSSNLDEVFSGHLMGDQDIPQLGEIFQRKRALGETPGKPVFLNQ